MRILIFFACLFSVVWSNAQVRVVNTSLTKPDTNLVYVGVEQILEITSKNKKIAGVSCDGATIKLLDGNKCSTLFMTSGEKMLKILYIDDKSSEYKMKSVWLPRVTVQLGNLTSGPATKEEILKSPFVNAYLKDCLLKIRYTVQKFELRVYDPTGSVLYTKQISGNTIKIGDVDFTSKLESGSKLEIRNIAVVSEGGRKMGAVPNYILEIK